MNRRLAAGCIALWLAAGFLPPAVCAARETVHREVEGPRPWYTFLKPARDNPADQLAYARTLRDRNSRRTDRHYRALVASWPNSPEAREAIVERARALDARGKKEKACEAYGEALDRFPASVPYAEFVDRQYVLAQDVLQSRAAPWLFGGFPTPERAVPLLEGVLKRAPQSSFAPKAQFQVAEAYEKSGDLEMALPSYGLVLSLYPETEWGRKAAFNRAMVLCELSRKSPNDRKMSEDAWHALTYVMQRFPDDPDMDRARKLLEDTNERRIRQAYRVALYYDRTLKRPSSALIAYRLFLERFPDAPQAGEVRMRIAELLAAPAPKEGKS